MTDDRRDRSDRASASERSTATAPSSLQIDPSAQPPVRRSGAPIAFPTRHAELLVVLVAVAGAEGVDGEAVSALLWPDATVDRRRRRLRTVLWQARRAIGPDADALRRTGGRLHLTGVDVVCDRGAVEALVDRWRAAR